MRALFVVSARLLLYNFSVVSLERNNLYLTFKYNYIRRFLHICCYCKYTTKHVDNNYYDLFVVA